MCRERAQAAARSANVLCSLSDHFKEDWPIDQAWIYGLRWKIQRRVFARDRCAQIWGVLQSGVYSLVLVTQIAFAPPPKPAASTHLLLGAASGMLVPCVVLWILPLHTAHNTEHTEAQVRTGMPLSRCCSTSACRQTPAGRGTLPSAPFPRREYALQQVAVARRVVA